MSSNQLDGSSKRIENVASIILAGGEGTRLFPLTMKRCKPAVTFGGRYRLIDIPISNSLNSSIPNIYIISQFFTKSLNQHIEKTFSLDNNDNQIEFFSPGEKHKRKDWYKGTADAVRKNLEALLETPMEYFLILSGDQLYSMDLNKMLEFAKEKNADLTIASLPVIEKEASRLGLLKINDDSFVTDFFEKPTDPEILKQYHLPEDFIRDKELIHMKAPLFLASMGIYIFKREALRKLLRDFKGDDFGKHLIPAQIKNIGKTAAFIYDGYWEDIGTIASFYKANLALTSDNMAFDLYNEKSPIYAQTLNLPCPRIIDTKIKNSIICQGSIIEAEEISHSMIGLKTHVGKGTIIRDSISLGNRDNILSSKSSYKIGKHCLIEKTIIDEHVQIGDHVKLINEKGLTHFDGDGLYIRDGIIVVTSGTSIPDHFVL